MRSRAVLRKHLSEGGEGRLVGHVDVGAGSAGPGATATAAAATAACREKKNDRVNGLNKKKIQGARNPREGICQWMAHRKRYHASEGGGDKVKIVTSASTATSTGGTAAAAAIALVAVTALRLGGEGSRLEGEEVGVGDSSLAAAAGLLALALLALANDEGRILRGAKQTVGHDQRHS